jgi:hypothetical protein
MQDNPEQYWLRHDVYLCVVPTAAVLMDVAQNRYFAISTADARGIASLVAGWPTDPLQIAESPAHPLDADQAADLARKLRSMRLLTDRPDQGKTADPHILSLTDVTVGAGLDVSLNRSLRFSDVLKLAGAYLYALAVTRFGLLRWGIRFAQRRKTVASAVSVDDQRQLLECVSIFRRARVFLFRARDKCLLHALFLRTFLRFYGLQTTWVFGVKVNPWGAHTWLQHGHMVVDGSPEDVRRYTPILVI